MLNCWWQYFTLKTELNGSKHTVYFFDPSIVPILVIFMTTSVFVCYLQIVTTTNLQSGLKNNSPFEAKKFVCIFLCINVQLWKVKYTYKLTQSSEYSCFMLITTKLKQVSHIHTTYTSDHPHSLCKWAVQKAIHIASTMSNQYSTSEPSIQLTQVSHLNCFQSDSSIQLKQASHLSI